MSCDCSKCVISRLNGGYKFVWGQKPIPIEKDYNFSKGIIRYGEEEELKFWRKLIRPS